MTTYILQVALYLNIVGRPGMIRKIDTHLAIPRHAAAQRLIDLSRQNPHAGWLPVPLQIHGDLVGLRPFGRGKVDVQRLIKPVCRHRLTLQIAVDKAEFTVQILQRAVERFNKQAVITQVNVAFGGNLRAVQRNIKM